MTIEKDTEVRPIRKGSCHITSGESYQHSDNTNPSRYDHARIMSLGWSNAAAWNVLQSEETSQQDLICALGTSILNESYITMTRYHQSRLKRHIYSPMAKKRQRYPR